MHEKMRQFIQKNKFFTIGVMSICGALIIATGVFAMTRGVNPHISELAFIEDSSGNLGSVIPASCNSNPPTNHGGDCPPGVEVNISDKPSTITASFTNIWPTNSWYGNGYLRTPGVPNHWAIGDNTDWTSTPSIQVNVSFSSNDATECWVYRDGAGWMRAGTSGSFTITVSAGGTTPFALNCTDGVYWKNVPGSVYGEWSNVRPDNGD